MKKQISHFLNLNLGSALVVIISLFITQPLIAQTVIWEAMATSTWGQENDVDDAKKGKIAIAPTSLDDNLYRVPYTGSFVDFKFPDNLDNYKYVHVTVRGADGGNRTYHDLLFTTKVKGGGGATLSGYFKLGDGVNEIPGGATFRFISGQKGATVESRGTQGADGGAGTGLFMNKGSSNDTWEMLMVAGGGGGAYSDCCSVKSEGRSAELGPNGGDGPGNGGDGGVDGDKGGGAIAARGGGGTSDIYQDGAPVGAFYKDANEHLYNFGCGYGGQCNKKPSGAGGGGYSGGGAGHSYWGGAGGGSYYNEDIYSLMVKGVANGATDSPADGYIEFQFITTDFPSTRIRAMNKQGFCIGTPAVQSNALMLVGCEVPAYRRYWNVKDLLLNLNISGRCMVKNPSNDDVILGNCITSDHKKWTYNAIDQEIKTLEDNEKCLAWDNLYLKVENCNNTENQKWGIDGATVNLAEQKVASIRPYIHQGHCIDNSAGKTDNHNKIQIWNCGGTDGNNNQKWVFEGDAIRLSNHRNKCLDIPNSNTSNGTNLQLYDCNGTNAQKWMYDGFDKVIRSKINSSKCIDLENGNTANGTYVQIWDCQTENTNMQWILKEATPNTADEVQGYIKMAINSSKCIDLKNENVSNGANIQIWDCNGSQAQYWFLDTDKQIKLMKNPTYCLSLKSTTGPPNGDNVHIWQCKGQNNQKWIYDSTNHLFKSQLNTGKCLDSMGSVNGSNLQVWPCDPTAVTQQFKFN